MEYDDLLEEFTQHLSTGVSPQEARSMLGKNPKPKAEPVAPKKVNPNNLGVGRYDKNKGGHEHDQHDENTLQRHLQKIDEERKARNDPVGRTALHMAVLSGDFKEVINYHKLILSSLISFNVGGSSIEE